MSIEERVLGYLRSNPGATPREIADVLGVSLSAVRLALNRLRESGSVIRSSRGGYVARVSEGPIGLEYVHVGPSKGDLGLADLVKTVNELVNRVNELAERVSKLENEVKYLKKSLPEVSRGLRKLEEDRLLTALKLRGIVGIEDARKVAIKPLEEYVSYGKAVIIDEFVISPEFLSRFKSRFPIRVTEVDGLSPEERELLKVLIKAGYVYLHSGMEYRYLDR